MRVEGADIFGAEDARESRTEVDPACETKAEVVVTGVEEAAVAVRAGRTCGTWRGGPSLSAR